MSDKRPDPRFAMIALEMEAEANPSPAGKPAQPTLLVSEGRIACPRCGNSAFEPMKVSGVNLNQERGSPVVVCMGCPLPAPVYPLPDGVTLDTNRYRCGSCGKQSQVTMTLSDVNLYCGNCGGLALHARQYPPPPVKKRLTAEARRRLDDVVAMVTGAKVAYGPSVIVDEANDVLLPQNHPALVELTKAMLSILRLEDFDEYAARKRQENMERKLPTERQTGRTWRGLVELLARYYLTTTRPTVWVLGGSESVDAWLYREVMSMRAELGNDHPTKIQSVPAVLKGEAIAQIVRREAKLPSGVMLLVDHTYYEQKARQGRNAWTYKPE